MFIQIQHTPNPETQKFVLEETITQNSMSFNKDDDMSSAPIAKNLLGIHGVRSVFISQNFISVTKSEEVGWSAIRAIVTSCITEFLDRKQPLILAEGAVEQGKTQPEDNSEIAVQIREILETNVLPAVRQDGGEITFVKYENGVVYLKLLGACAGCPSSTITLKNGIENLLKYYLPEVESVEAVQD